MGTLRDKVAIVGMGATQITGKTFYDAVQESSGVEFLLDESYGQETAAESQGDVSAESQGDVSAESQGGASAESQGGASDRESEDEAESDDAEDG